MKVNLWQIKFAYPFVSKDVLRSYMQGVYIINKDNNQYVIATDTRVCLVIINKGVNGENEKIDIKTLDGKPPKIDKKDLSGFYEIESIGEKKKREYGIALERFDDVIKIGNYKFVREEDERYPDVFSKIINLDYKQVQFPKDFYIDNEVKKKVTKLFPDITNDNVFMFQNFIKKQIINAKLAKENVEMFLYFMTNQRG